MGLDSELRAIRLEVKRIRALLGEDVAPRPLAYTRRDAAKRLGIGLTLMNQLIRKGLIRLTEPIGRRRLVPESEIQRLLQAKK